MVVGELLSATIIKVCMRAPKFKGPEHAKLDGQEC